MYLGYPGNLRNCLVFLELSSFMTASAHSLAGPGFGAGDGAAGVAWKRRERSLGRRVRFRRGGWVDGKRRVRDQPDPVRSLPGGERNLSVSIGNRTNERKRLEVAGDTFESRARGLPVYGSERGELGPIGPGVGSHHGVEGRDRALCWNPSRGRLRIRFGYTSWTARGAASRCGLGRVGWRVT